jgi:hypothetical protein
MKRASRYAGGGDLPSWKRKVATHTPVAQLRLSASSARPWLPGGTATAMS